MINYASSEITQQEHLSKASAAVRAGEKSMKEAALHLAAAKLKGAQQKDMAKAVGKSEAWVSQLLAWHDSGCENTPFGAQSKAKRDKKKKIQAPKLAAQNGKSELLRLPAPKIPSPIDDVFDDVEESGVEVDSGEEGEVSVPFSGALRGELLEALDDLSNISPLYQAKAARRVSRIRRKVGKAWDQLIVPPFTGWD